MTSTTSSTFPEPVTLKTEARRNALRGADPGHSAKWAFVRLIW